MSGKQVEELVREFSPLLDEALIIALISDHDLNDPAQLDEARYTLQALSQDVPTEEATGFNPSGIADAMGSMSVDGGNDGGENSSNSHGSTSYAAGDSDSCSTAITSPPPDGRASPLPRIRAFEGESEETQVVQLQEMFADLKPHDVQLAFRKANGDFQATLEDLLTKQYLESTGERTRGIDTFFSPEAATATKKNRKRKGKQRRGGTSTIGSSESSQLASPASPTGADDKSLEDVLYVAEKLDLPFEEVFEVFSVKGSSKEGTIVEFLERYIEEGVLPYSEEAKQRAESLSNEHQSIPERYLPPLLGIVGDVPHWVEEIASLLNTYFASLPPQRLAINYKLTPLAGEDIDGFTTAPSKTRQKTVSSAAAATGAVPGLPLSSSSSGKPPTYQDALAAVNAQAAARSHSYASASASFRKGNSNPLFRQAAGFYADRAREDARGFATARSAAADVLVADNSSRDVVDLHGVTVLDGVRIAKERAWVWWNGLGEYRDQEARRGFTVITGLGRHSASGVSRMRQSVAAALIEDGWKVSVETGRFTITGRRRAVWC